MTLKGSAEAEAALNRIAITSAVRRKLADRNAVRTKATPKKVTRR
jgi:hypothetical protein